MNNYGKIKIKINDASELREELNELYDRATHKQVAEFSLLLGKHILNITSFPTNEILEKGFKVNK
ncbi:hypothetical protein BN85401960 [Alteracholeplasma palmae J233]|uniref:Uncharacterized protein n=1 Tax=Alteracholeplasma palmae (strain ATCC 49389 / J233) TaxID=1318466 RepID=U4KJX7_ALTPJ|nr:hypothetical protein [Alteracholeplasma palmae]CCV63773.1 hypothetical protein BN85401960 [Alteracholeplasma palmae J233]